MVELLEGFYNTSPLWKKEQFGIPQFGLPKLNNAVSDYSNIPTNLRLGHQMEYVFQAIIKKSSEYQLLQSNILIDEGKQRLGELDFILKDVKRDRILHLELAYKFYIVNPEISEPVYRLMGPNKRDMFYTKLDKLKEKQFPLLYHKNLNPLWDTHGINPLEIEQQCCFKAQLFMPYSTQQISIRPLNTDCIVGKWIRFDDFNTPEFAAIEYYIPRKQEWVIHPHVSVPWMNHFDTLMEINLRMVKENAPMLWMKNSSGEIEKLFVVWW